MTCHKGAFMADALLGAAAPVIPAALAVESIPDTQHPGAALQGLLCDLFATADDVRSLVSVCVEVLDCTVPLSAFEYRRTMNLLHMAERLAAGLAERLDGVLSGGSLNATALEAQGAKGGAA
jgi:hypothetical protein